MRTSSLHFFKWFSINKLYLTQKSKFLGVLIKSPDRERIKKVDDAGRNLAAKNTVMQEKKCGIVGATKGHETKDRYPFDLAGRRCCRILVFMELFHETRRIQTKPDPMACCE